MPFCLTSSIMVLGEESTLVDCYEILLNYFMYVFRKLKIFFYYEGARKQFYFWFSFLLTMIIEDNIIFWRSRCVVSFE